MPIDTSAARPELKTRDFFVTGESYGGHYIPVVSHHIWRTNKAKAEGERINLKGFAIGNGLCASNPPELCCPTPRSDNCDWQALHLYAAAVLCLNLIATSRRSRHIGITGLDERPGGRNRVFFPRRTVPEIQFGAYSVYAKEKGLITAGQAAVLQQARAVCQELHLVGLHPIMPDTPGVTFF